MAALSVNPPAVVVVNLYGVCRGDSFSLSVLRLPNVGGAWRAGFVPGLLVGG
jgi:hypothetical protein